MESSLKNMFLSLTTICVISAAILALLNEQTKDKIAEVKQMQLENAIKEILPEYDNSPLDEMYEVSFSEKDKALIYPAKKDSSMVGVAIETSSDGFGGQIKILTALSSDGAVLDYKVLQHSETPGLGDKMGAWFKTDKNNQSILGKNLSKRTLKLKKDGGDIDGITASTISSRAFLEAVNKAYSAYFGNTDSNTGATSASDGESGATTDAESGATSSSDAKTEVTN